MTLDERWMRRYDEVNEGRKNNVYLFHEKLKMRNKLGLFPFN